MFKSEKGLEIESEKKKEQKKEITRERDRRREKMRIKNRKKVKCSWSIKVVNFRPIFWLRRRFLMTVRLARLPRLEQPHTLSSGLPDITTTHWVIDKISSRHMILFVIFILGDQGALCQPFFKTLDLFLFAISLTEHTWLKLFDNVGNDFLLSPWRIKILTRKYKIQRKKTYRPNSIQFNTSPK